MVIMANSLLYRAGFLFGLGFYALGCGKTPSPTAEKEAPLVASAASTLSASASAASIERQEPPKPKQTPTFVPQKFNAPEGNLGGPYQVGGVIAVVDGLKVGRIVEDRVEWLKTMPEDESNRVALGGSTIRGVSGQWPDAVDVYYVSNQGRASRPTVYPLTGKGAAHTVASGGGLGDIVGTATLGASSLVISVSPAFGGVEFVTTRGPGLVIKPQSPEKAGCKNQRNYFSSEPPAVVPRGAGSTPAGTLLSVGGFCNDDDPALEVWDKPGKSRIIDLRTWIKTLSWRSQILKGKDDEAWIYTGPSNPILRYYNGNVQALPLPAPNQVNIIASSSGKLYVNDGMAIHRWDENKWTLLAHLNWKTDFYNFAVDDKETIWVYHGGGVSKLVEGPSIAFKEGCAAPFVYMYEVSPENDNKFTFPSTRKALSNFEGVQDLGLVEFFEDGRKLGITVKSKEQGEALIAHIKANMKKENPTLLCYEPKNPRKIEMKNKGK